MRMGMLSAMGIGVLLFGCAPKAETPEQADQRMASEATAARTGIEASNQQFMIHFNAGHGDSVAAIYAENGRMMAPNMAVAVGREAIAKGLADMAGMKPTLELKTESVVASGPVAVEMGTYKFTGTPPGMKDPITDTGKYLVHWQKVGDKWLMAEDIWNSDLPAMAMPAPPPMKKM